MLERIQLIMKVKNLTPSQFADKIEIQRSTVSHLLTGRNKPSLDILLKIINCFPDVDSTWLITGDGQMNKQEQISRTKQLSLEIPVESFPQVHDIKKKSDKKQVEFSIADLQSKIEKVESKGLVKNIEKIILLYSDGSFEYYGTK